MGFGVLEECRLSSWEDGSSKEKEVKEAMEEQGVGSGGRGFWSVKGRWVELKKKEAVRKKKMKRGREVR